MLMPTISIFIRNEDLPLWTSIEHKSQWLHDNLPNNLPENGTSVLPIKPADMSQDDWDESLEGQCAAQGFTVIEYDPDMFEAQLHVVKGDASIDSNHYWFDVKSGKVIF